MYSYGVADNLAGNLTSFGEVEQACLLNFIFWDAGCVSRCHRGSCPALGRVAGELPIDGRSVDCGEHGIAFGWVLDVVGDLDCVPGSHTVRTYDESRAKKRARGGHTPKFSLIFLFFSNHACVAHKDTGIKIGRAHVRTPVTRGSRMPSSA